MFFLVLDAFNSVRSAKAKIVKRSEKEVTIRSVPIRCAIRDEVLQHPDKV